MNQTPCEPEGNDHAKGPEELGHACQRFLQSVEKRQADILAFLPTQPPIGRLRESGLFNPAEQRSQVILNNAFTITFPTKGFTGKATYAPFIVEVIEMNQFRFSAL